MRSACVRLALCLLLAPLWAAAPSSGAASPAAGVTVYVGTYTDGASRGIYRFTLDPATGAVTAPVLAAETKNPSFLAWHPSGRFLYAVGEVDSLDGRATGAVSAFAANAKTGELTLLNQKPSEGTGPCHLVVDRAGKNVLVANYGGGSVAVLPIGVDGRLGAASSVRVHEGRGPNPNRQEKPHAHGIYLDAAERFAFVPDLGTDRVVGYRFDAAKGLLEPSGSTPLPPGSGPRHLAFDPAGSHVYVINELLSTLSAFAYDAARGAWTALGTVPTLPAGFSGTNTTAEVAVSPDGRFVYGSNRGHDSIVVFRVLKDGRLELAGHSFTGGKAPRHFALDPSGRWLLAAHQGSDTIAVLRVDPATGAPVSIGTTVAVAKPVCVLFAPGPH